MRDRRHARGVPGLGRRGGDRVLQPVQRRVQVIAVRQQAGVLRRLRPAPREHHHHLRHCRGDVLAAVPAHQMQRQIDAGGDAGAGQHRAVVDEDPVGQHLRRGREPAQPVEQLVVRRRLPAGQQSGVGRQQRAAAHRQQPQGPGRRARRGQPWCHHPAEPVACGQPVRRRADDLVHLARPAQQHQPGRLRRIDAFGQRLQPAEHQPDRRGGLWPRADVAHPEGRRLSSPAQRLVGEPEGLGGPRQIEQQRVGQDEEDDVDHGRLMRRPAPRPGGSSRSARPARSRCARGSARRSGARRRASSCRRSASPR